MNTHRLMNLLARCAVWAVLALWPALPAMAEGMDEAEANRVAARLAGELQSPFCPGKTLRSCTSGKAYDLRREIQRRLVGGETEQAVVDDLAKTFGEQIRNPPQPWYTFILPFIPFAAGILLVIWAVRRMRRQRRAEVSGDPALAAAGAGIPDRLDRLRRQVSSDDE